MATAPSSDIRPDALPFTIGHGTLNDFVIIEDVDGALDLTPELVTRLADRRGGIGADGVIRVVRTARAGIDAPPGAPEWCMDYRNADGSLAQMCGNGVRVFAAYLDRAGLAPGPDLEIWTRAGRRRIEILSGPGPDARAPRTNTWTVRVGMGAARLRSASQREVRIAGHELPAWDVDMGNPHTVAQLPEGMDLAEVDLTSRPALSQTPPEGTNIEFYVPRGPHHVAMRVFERGVGETMSCGTGAAAVAVAAAHRSQEDLIEPWRIDVPGGSLVVAQDEHGEITLAGPAVLVADGRLLG